LIRAQGILVEDQEQFAPHRMNKGGVLSEFIHRDTSTPQTIAEEEAAMKQMASTFQQFDFDYITAGQGQP